MTLILEFALRGSAFDHQIPAPPPPPLARNVGGRDPYPHLLESQSAMSMLMMQMVGEMNEMTLKNFDGLGPFSYVCRMIRFFEPNTKEVEPEVFVDSAFEESVVGDQRYVCVSILRE